MVPLVAPPRLPAALACLSIADGRGSALLFQRLLRRADLFAAVPYHTVPWHWPIIQYHGTGPTGYSVGQCRTKSCMALAHRVLSGATTEGYSTALCGSGISHIIVRSVRLVESRSARADRSDRVDSSVACSAPL